MAMTYDDAVTALYRAPLDHFVAERKRLASELKGHGDKAGATRLAALARPPVSAWAVNQLYWEARASLDELFAAGERLRAGDLAATNAHREALAKLRTHAETVLAAGGHGATEATLRRIMTDLSALAAVGSFDPDPPGALAGDREPPGFDTFGMAALETAKPAAVSVKPSPHPAETADAQRKKEAHAAREREERELRELERRKAEAERTRKRVERERLEAALRNTKGELDVHQRQVERLRSELAKAEKAAAQEQANVAELESRLAALESTS